ncbi:MAG: tetrahydromethanopterin S-methyltransferase subunit B [Candidatus Methanoperedens sp.]|nr:tetrahydromethanopterin S-methyltransferase subunit B [Candidatus Methanoperedens sp.]
MTFLPDWPPVRGEYATGDPNKQVAIITLASELDKNRLLKKAAIVGTMKTENIGIEKVVVNLAAVVDKIDRLDDIASDLFKSLDPMTTPLVSYPNREGIYLNLGRVTNMVYGLMAGLLIAALIILAIGVEL